MTFQKVSKRRCYDLSTKCWMRKLMIVRLISWNINKRRAIDEQVAALAERQPDLVALQELKARHLDALRDLFAQVGLPYVLDSKVDSEISHRGYVVIASRWPLKRKQG